MASAGKMLQAERIKRNRTISSLASETCISSRYLAAIEEDNLDVVPGQFFYRSFIKQYAQALELNADTTKAILGAAKPMDEVDPVPALSMAYETAKQERRRMYRPRTGVAIALLATVLIGCSALYSIWQRAQAEKEISPEPEPSRAPATTASPLQAPQPASTSAPAPSEERAVSPVKPMSPPQAAPDEAPSRVPVAARKKIHVGLAATEKTWVSLSSHGKTVFRGVLGPTQRKNFAISEHAKLMTGNAAGLDVRWNGKPIGPIGSRGQVRTVLLNADHYEILPPRGL
jgi:cytoskeleton protein RodZ